MGYEPQSSAPSPTRAVISACCAVGHGIHWQWHILQVAGPALHGLDSQCQPLGPKHSAAPYPQNKPRKSHWATKTSRANQASVGRLRRAIPRSRPAGSQVRPARTRSAAAARGPRAQRLDMLGGGCAVRIASAVWVWVWGPTPILSSLPSSRHALPETEGAYLGLRLTHPPPECTQYYPTGAGPTAS